MAAVLLLLTLGASLGRAQVTIYARFLNGTGVWAGESTAPGRTGWAELKSVSFGAYSEPTAGGGGGRRASFENITLSKNVDRLSPQIFSSVTQGTRLSSGGVTIEFVRTAAAGPVTFFRLELRDPLITQTSSSAAAGDGNILERLVINTDAMRYTHWPILANGSQGTPVVFAFDLAVGAPGF